MTLTISDNQEERRLAAEALCALDSSKDAYGTLVEDQTQGNTP